MSLSIILTAISSGAVFGLLFYWKKMRKSSKRLNHKSVNQGENMAEYGIEVLENDGKDMINNPYPHLRIVGSIFIPSGKTGKLVAFDVTQGKEPFFVVNANDDYSKTKILKQCRVETQNGKAIIVFTTADVRKNEIGFTLTYGEY